MGRVALHAAALEVLHPATGETVRIECPPPRDFAVALKYLNRFALPGGGGGRAAELSDESD